MFKPPFPADIDNLIRKSLEEDIGTGDITSRSIIDPQQIISANVITREPITLCGLEIFCAVFQKLDTDVKFPEKLSNDGDHIGKNEIIVKLQGNCLALLEGERTALNVLQKLCGIATLTSEYVKKASPVTILDTRKTTPGLRVFEKYAVQCGGGTNHRFGLYDAVLIKDNHIKAAGSISEAVNKAKRGNKANTFIEVESVNLSEVKEALTSGVDRILLDNMDLKTIHEAVSIIGGKVQTEVSGGITLENLSDLSNSGVDFISVGALTHSAKASDISMNFD
jgi:nicotinate-nucleotide pyrophosphorylase (carboxylating)